MFTLPSMRVVGTAFIERIYINHKNTLQRIHAYIAILHTHEIRYRNCHEQDSCNVSCCRARVARHHETTLQLTHVYICTFIYTYVHACMHTHTHSTYQQYIDCVTDQEMFSIHACIPPHIHTWLTRMHASR